MGSAAHRLLFLVENGFIILQIETLFSTFQTTISISSDNVHRALGSSSPSKHKAVHPDEVCDTRRLGNEFGVDLFRKLLLF